MKRCRILVFAKAPVSGQVKTRLIPALGAEGAAALHRRLVHHSLATACAAQPACVELWCAPDPGHAFFSTCAKQFSVSLHTQQGVDLGEKMAHAIADGLQRAEKILLVGTDCPAMKASDLHAAAAALSNKIDAVFIPVADGGYALVGANKNIASAFASIDWSTAQVMQQTRARLRQAKLRWHELPELWDVDTPQELLALRALPAFADILMSPSNN
jgi:rSAM/selenodomain-associated transferase 1